MIGSDVLPPFARTRWWRVTMLQSEVALLVAGLLLLTIIIIIITIIVVIAAGVGSPLWLSGARILSNVRVPLFVRDRVRRMSAVKS
jgi:hypothetical protein